MPTVLPTNLSKEQEEAYLCKYLGLICQTDYFCDFCEYNHKIQQTQGNPTIWQ